MATNEKFINDFAYKLREEYGDQKITQERVMVMWNALKHLPDDLLSRCASEVRARHIYFPGVDKAIAISLEIFKEFTRNNIPLNPIHGCGRCSQGARVIDNYAFQCPCALGKANYPTLSPYTGQANFVDRFSETATEIVRETRSHIYVTDKVTMKTSFQLKPNPWRDHNPNRNDSYDRRAKEAYETF